MWLKYKFLYQWWPWYDDDDNNNSDYDGDNKNDQSDYDNDDGNKNIHYDAAVMMQDRSIVTCSNHLLIIIYGSNRAGKYYDD